MFRYRINQEEFTFSSVEERDAALREAARLNYPVERLGEKKPKKKISAQPTGIELMIEKYREIFRIPENLSHYSESDFMTAERKFLKWALGGGESNREQLLELLTRG